MYAVRHLKNIYSICLFIFANIYTHACMYIYVYYFIFAHFFAHIPLQVSNSSFLFRFANFFEYRYNFLYYRYDFFYYRYDFFQHTCVFFHRLRRVFSKILHNFEWERINLKKIINKYALCRLGYAHPHKHMQLLCILYCYNNKDHSNK